MTFINAIVAGTILIEEFTVLVIINTICFVESHHVYFWFLINFMDIMDMIMILQNCI